MVLNFNGCKSWLTSMTLTVPVGPGGLEQLDRGIDIGRRSQRAARLDNGHGVERSFAVVLKLSQRVTNKFDRRRRVGAKLGRSLHRQPWIVRRGDREHFDVVRRDHEPINPPCGASGLDRPRNERLRRQTAADSSAITVLIPLRAGIIPKTCIRRWQSLPIWPPTWFSQRGPLVVWLPRGVSMRVTAHRA